MKKKWQFTLVGVVLVGITVLASWLLGPAVAARAYTGVVTLYIGGDVVLTIASACKGGRR